MRARCVLALLSVMCLLSTQPAAALDPQRPLAEFTLTSWGREDGLPHSFIIDLAQSSDGYLWAATWQGAVRFNGREFVVFDQQRLPWNRDGSVWALAQGADGSLLLASQRYGVSRLRGGDWSQEQRVADAPTPIFSLLEDPSGQLWVGSEGGLLRVGGGSPRRFGVRDGLPDNSVLSLSAAPDGTVWLGTANGAARIDGDTVSAFGPQQGLPPGEIGMLLAAADGSVRAGSKQGAYRLEGDRFVRDPVDLPTDEVSALLVDRQGTLWIGTIGHGIFRAGARGLERLGAEQGLPSNHVNALIEDTQGNIWIATHGGLAQLRETRFAIYSRREGLADDFVRAVAEDARGAMWVATNGGISRIADGRIEGLSDRHPDTALPSLSILPRSNGELWFGTYSHGIRVLDASGVRGLGRGQGLVGDEVRGLLEARDGAIWVATASGLTRLAGDRPRSWTRLAGSNRTLYARALLQTVDGRVWVGMQQGLAWSDGELLEPIATGADDPLNVYALAECAHGAVWAVGAGGIRRLRDGRLDRLHARHGLDDSAIFGLRSDGRGTDWLSTADGLLAIEHDRLEQAMDGAAGRLPMTRYGDGAGSESLALNGGSNPAVQRSTDGRIWLATAQGVAVFDPAHLTVPVESPPTVIERIQIDGADRDVAQARRLPPATRRIEFDYAGLSYLAPDSLRYRHRLQGYDSDWVEAGKATTVSYTNLAPGDYRFEVEALVEGAKGPPRRALHAFKLEPHLHQTAGFRIGSLLVLLLLAAGLYRLRIGGLRRQAQTLQDLVEQRTRELQSRSQRLEQADQEKAALIERLREQSSQLERHAQEDGLTGLANRRRLDAAVQSAIEHSRSSGEPLALALIDIDYFKQVNDALGHGAGDDVLRAIAALIGARAQPPMIAGRYGGEEFAVILPGYTLAAAHDWCERLRVAVQDLHPAVQADHLTISVSIGVAMLDADQAGQPYAAADRRLYAAKQSGRNRVCG